MPIMKVDDILRVEPGMDSAVTEDGTTKMEDEVQILGTAEVDTPAGKVPWTKIRLFTDVVTPEGWVRSSNVDPAGVVPGGPIDKLAFASDCWVEALFSDANPHYVAAVAEMRSETSSGQQAGNPPLSGPFRFTQAEWDAARVVPEFGVTSYSARDIADWRMQVVLFTLMTHRTEARLTADLDTIADRRPSAAELYLAQLIGAKAAVAALTKDPRPTLQEAFDGVAAADQAADRPLGESNFSNIVARYAEVLDPPTLKGDDAIDRIVARLDPVLTTTKDNIISAGTALLGAFPPEATVDGAGNAFPEFDPSSGKPFDQKAPFIMRRLLSDFPVFKDFHAAAILGNIGRETGGLTLMQEVRPRKGRGGLGWLQWTGPRRIDFETFCQPPAPSTATDEGNYTFMRHELRGKEQAGRKLFEATTDIDRATEVFMSKVERPGVTALAERKDFARRALSLFHSAGAARGGGAAGGGGAAASGPVVEKLRALIDSGAIIFDKASLKNELLGLNIGTRVTPRLQAFVVKLTELAAPQKIRISSLIRIGTGSHHTEGRAVDIGNQEIATALLPKIATDEQVRDLGIDELIFNAGFPSPQRFNYDRGVRHDFDQVTLNEHGNHIHFAVIA
jgi:hypothetical protein